ncbi:hypothetical protein F4775DRAFT_571228 [Biscogniauxia sp. FL1348]|nr:hypothetical protein F4775DRAFT_571228 [Biscogniauxia sp. FL1348]
MGKGIHIPVLSGRFPTRSPASISDWRPSYLRGSVLLVFGLFVAVLITLLQVLLDVSDRHHGLAASHNRLRYLWTYGPTAILTLLAAFWSRVEYQTKLTAPWLSMSKGPCEAHKSVLLDYISMLQPWAICRALRNRHFAVFAATTVSLIIRISIPISTALITLAPTPIFRTDVPLTLKSEFVDSPAKLRQNSGLASYTLRGYKSTSKFMPDGVSSEYAYQLVESSLSTSQSLAAKVEGLSAGLTCESAHMVDDPGNFTPYRIGSNYDVIQDRSAIVTSQRCRLNVEYTTPSLTLDGDLGIGYQLRDFGRFMPGNCTGSSSDSDQRVSIIFATMNYTVNKITEDEMEILNASVSRYTSLICTPTYAIKTLDLSQDENSTSVSAPNNASSRQLSNVNAWDIMQAHLDSTKYNGGGSSFEFPVDQDDYVGLAAEFADANNTLPSADAVFEPGGAEDFMTRYYKQFVAVLAHDALMQSASTPSSATAWTLEDRLIVRAIAAYWMTGLFATSLMLIVLAWVTFPRRTFLPRNPGSVAGTAALLARSYPFVHSFRNRGAANMADISYLSDGNRYELLSDGKDWSKEKSFSIVANRRLPEYDNLELSHAEKMEWRPLTLHPAYRLSIYAVLVAIFVVLEVTLQKSLRENGLGDVGDGSYIHFSWTISPAVLLTLLGMYFAAADFDTRALAPYSHLCRGASFKSSLSLDLLDSFTMQTFLKEFRSRSFAALAGTMAVAFTSFLTIASASLFYTIYVPDSWPMSLSFDNITEEAIVRGFLLQGGGTSASLVLLSNMSYPAFTFENLALPDVSFTSNQSELQNATNFITKARVPATRSRLTCRLYDNSQIRTNLSLSESSDPGQNPNMLTVSIAEELCTASAETSEVSNLVLGLGSMPNTSYFGGCKGEPDHLSATDESSSRTVGGCSELLWIWGHWDLSTAEPINSVSALGCNESIETVEVDGSFFGSELRINSDQPPTPDEDTSTYLFTPSNQSALAVLWSPSAIYTTLVPTYSATDNLGSCMTLITNSRYAIPVEMLGDAGQASAVANALRFHHGVIRAQSLKTGLDEGPSAIADDGSASTANITQTIGAETMDPSRRRRVFQDLASTRVLQALLLATLLCSALSWALMPETKILPRKTTCVASVAALLADGNVLDYLARDAPWASVDELECSFGENVVFRLGWRPSAVGQDAKDGFAVYVDAAAAAAAATPAREAIGAEQGGEDESLMREADATTMLGTLTSSEPSRAGSARGDGYSTVGSEGVSVSEMSDFTGQTLPSEADSIQLAYLEYRQQLL